MRYLAWEREVLRTRVPVLIGIVFVANFVWLGSDWVIYPETFHRMLWPRLGAVHGGTVLAALLLQRGFPLGAFVTVHLTTTAGAAAVVAAAGGAGDPYISGVMFVIFGIAAIVPVRAGWHAFSAIVAMVTFVVGCTWLHPEQTALEIGQQIFVLAWVLIVTLIGMHLFQRQKASELHTAGELEEANLALARARDHANAMNIAKNVFLANMSHELRTPLNAVIGYAELLRDEAQDVQPDWIDDLDRIRDSGRYLLRLVNDVLDLSKVAAGKLNVHPETVELQPFFEELGPMAAAQCEAHRNTFSTAIDVDTVWADPIRLRQILLNLLSNAAKFTEDGTVTVTARGSSGRVEFEVRDTGRGMNAAQLEGVFEAFVQVHDTDHERLGGTGLGLALSRELARSMGGDLTVVSEPGVGSTFTLTLPARGPT